MSNTPQEIVEQIMQQVAAGHEREPGRATVSYSFTLSDPEEVAKGPETFELFEARLRAFYPGAKIAAKGYAASGYNIIARVDK